MPKMRLDSTMEKSPPQTQLPPCLVPIACGARKGTQQGECEHLEQVQGVEEGGTSGSAFPCCS